MVGPAVQVRMLRRRLGSLWNVFFGGFGRLTEVQMAAMPLLLDRHNAVICSPTASGKTEAVLAPIVRHLLDAGSGRPGPEVLYIAPTRALVADLERRLAPLFRQVDVTAAFRTSDSPHLPAVFPQVLVTTPESFDSLLGRKRTVWKHLRVLILDELHLLDHTSRGDQLRVLLHRLQAEHVQGTLHKIAMSATIPDPEGMAKRYLGEARLVTVGEARPLDFKVVTSLADAIALCRAEKRHKILVFCNARRDCEELAAQAVEGRLWPRDAVFVHHASLSRAVRREVEAALRESSIALCFATMTLELGIDIGDINAAVCYQPPPDLDAFQQRLGRACRRERRIFALGIAKDLLQEEAFRVYEEMTHEAQSNRVEYSPDLSVVVQQVLSTLFAHPGGVERQVMFEHVAMLCEPDEYLAILLHLTEEDYVQVRGWRLLATERTMDLGEKGEVHSNIADTRAMEVYDSQSGRVIGQVAWSPDAKEVVLGGRYWKITGRGGSRLHVAPTGRPVKAGRFRRRSGHGRFHDLLPSFLQAPPPGS
mgnify:CR=1 FL=1